MPPTDLTASAPPPTSGTVVEPVFEAAPAGPPFSRLIDGMQGSEVLKIAAEVRQVMAAGRPVCNLTVGDFSPAQFPIPEALRAALADAVARGETNYPPSDGVLDLRRAIVDFVVREQSVAYPVEAVLVAAGVRPLLYAACCAVLDPGDTLVYGVPSWNTNHYGWLTQARAVAVDTTAADGFHPTLEALQPHLGAATLIALCSPANPTGTMMPGAELARITAAVVEENRRRAAAGARPLYLLWDQVYGGLVHGTEPHVHPVQLVPEAAPWVIALDGISKVFAATGLRVGWSLAAPGVTARMRDFLGHVGAWAPKPEQVATARFLRDAPAIAAFRDEMDRGVRQRLDALVEGFDALKADGLPVDLVHPQGAIYLSLRLNLVGWSCDATPIRSNEDIRRLLLEQAGFAVVPFQAFGLAADTGWFRLSVGAVSPDDIAQVLPRIRALLLRCQPPA